MHTTAPSLCPLQHWPTLESTSAMLIMLHQMSVQQKSLKYMVRSSRHNWPVDLFPSVILCNLYTHLCWLLANVNEHFIGPPDVPATFVPGGTLSDQVVFIGHPLQLTCTATGAPPPTYQWFKDLLPLSPSPSVSVDSVSGRLYIGSTYASHTGRYTCTATNEIAGVGIVGNVTTSADVYVIGMCGHKLHV